jgi:hypothetical protein
MSELRVYAHLARLGRAARAAERCRSYQVNPEDPVLCVIATRRGPRALAEAIAAWGERPLVVEKDGSFKGIVEVRADSLVDFARQHPERLVAKSGTGLPAPRGADGTRETVWADLGDPSVDVTECRTTA